MRNIILYILLGFSLYSYGRVYQTSDSRSSKIGYTTYGMYQTNVRYNTSIPQQSPNTFYYKTSLSSSFNSQKSSYQATTYIPGSARPRKITVYNSNGETRETPGGDNDGDDWIYQYDESTKKWYCSPDNGVTWYEWRSKGFWEAVGGLLSGDWNFGNNWRSIKNEPTENTSKWAPDPEDPFLQPIGSPGVLLIMLLGYALYKRKNLVKQK